MVPSEQKRTRAQAQAQAQAQSQAQAQAQAQATEKQKEKVKNSGGENNEKVSDGSNQADRESSPEDLEDARPRAKRGRPQEDNFGEADKLAARNLIGNFRLYEP